MGSIIGSCIGTVFTGACCSMQSCLSTQMTGVAIFFMSSVFSLAFRYWGAWVVQQTTLAAFGLCDSNLCDQFEGVYRISFATAVFFGISAILATVNLSKVLRWCASLALWLLCLFCVWPLPDRFYDYYYHVARFAAACFLILQILLLISLSYDWSERLVEQGMQKIFLAASGILYSVAIAAPIVLIMWFGGDGCSRNLTWIVLTLLITFFASALSITEVIEHGSLLTSAIVTVYAWWLTFSALHNDPSPCNHFTNPADDSNLMWLIFGFVWACCSLTYAGYSMANNKHLTLKNVRAESSDSQQAALLEDHAAEKENIPEGDLEDQKEHLDDLNEEEEELKREEEYGGLKKSVKFNIIMMVASMYMALLVTNWESRASADGEITSLSSQAMWVQIVCVWAMLLLYIWTLVAPYLMPERDFN